MRLLKTSNKQLRRILVSVINEKELLRQQNKRLKERLEKYEGPEIEPGMLIQPVKGVA